MCGTLAVLVSAYGNAHAQADDAAPEPAPATATSAAEDAFGERVGIDQIGLYGESQARGFDLQSSGAYRIDGAYFVRAAPLSDSVASGLSVRVGVAATALDLPSPSGVVVYRLREPGPANALTVTTGLREYETPHLELLGTVVNRSGSLGVIAHALIRPHVNYPLGQKGPAHNAGAVVRWRPDEATSLRIFGAYAITRYDGSFAVVPADAAVPPPVRPRHDYSPAWAKADAQDLTGGLLFHHGWEGWSLDLSAIRSTNRANRSDFTILATDRDGDVVSTLYYTPPVETSADSGEIRLARTFAALGARHRIGIAARYRRSLVERAAATPFAAGTFTLRDGPAEVPQPTLPIAVPRGEDVVRQSIFSATYGIEFSDRAQLRLGAHRSRYDKRVLDFDDRASRRVQDTWLYNASVTWRPWRGLRLFASYVTGLEEVGVAPTSATNRGEVLPPVEARQTEVGARYELASGLNLIVAGFDIRKPTYGLRGDGAFALVGDVRHRGFEMSVAGRIGSGTKAVLGALILKPRVGGALVETGLVGRTPAGISRFNFIASVEQRLGSAWSADAQFKYDGPREIDSANSAKAPGVAILDLGAGWDLGAVGVPASLRVQLLNVANAHGYYATASGFLGPLWSRTFRVLLTANF
jgi:iron complex outermembrane receptor protein